MDFYECEYLKVRGEDDGKKVKKISCCECGAFCAYIKYFF